MSNPWKKNILDRSLDDLANDNQKYKKSGQYKKDLKNKAIADKKKAAADKRAENAKVREERIAAAIAIAETSVTGRIDLSQFFDDDKIKTLLGEFGTVETCKVRFAGKNLVFNAKFEDKEGAAKCLASEKLKVDVGELEATTTAPVVRGRNVYFRCPFTEEEQGDELNEKVKGLFESMSNDENKHVVTSVKVVNKNFSVNFESRDSVHAALKGYFEPLMLNNRKLGPVREGIPPRNVPAIKKRKQQNSNNNNNNNNNRNKKRTPRSNNKRRRR